MCGRAGPDGRRGSAPVLPIRTGRRTRPPRAPPAPPSAERAEHPALLHDLADEGAKERPASPAVSLGGTTMTFSTLSARVSQVAAVVESLTDPGDRVAIIGENSLPWVECYYAVPRAGRVLVFLNHRLAQRELSRILVRSGATLPIRATGS